MDLKDLGVYDLRNYARSIGVSSPTTKRKTELIEGINKVLKGDTPAVKNNRGRKPKHIALKLKKGFPDLDTKKEISMCLDQILSLSKEINKNLKEIYKLLFLKLDII